jgi:hypothetical protein
MVGLIISSIVVGVFVKGLLGQLLIFPCIIALYSTIKFYYSPKAKIIRENRKYDGRCSGIANYLFMFVYKYFICAVISGLIGLIVHKLH